MAQSNSENKILIVENKLKGGFGKLPGFMCAYLLRK